jgi:hypothetical protein
MEAEREPKLITGLETAEQAFFDPALLSTAYCQQSRADYLDKQFTAFLNPHRNYQRLLMQLEAIFEYNPNHARSFVKRLRTQASDWRNCEAVVAEVIVYYNHLALIYEGYVESLSLEGDECDLIVARRDGSKAFLEVLSLMPTFDPDARGLIAVQTHTQAALGSVRQKLLRKIDEQGQLASERENWAVIEINDARIAGQFTVLSSLSGGYQLRIDKSTMKAVSEGYDWSQSVFVAPVTQYLRGIIFFDLGNYADRHTLLNPYYKGPGASSPEA